MVKPKTPRCLGATEDEPSAPPPMKPASSDPVQGLETILAAHSKQFECILQAIQDTKSSLESKIDAITLDVGLLRADHRKLVSRVASVETNLSELQPTTRDLQHTVKRLATEVHVLQRRAEDAEGRSRRNNVRFMGFAEGSETHNMELFLETWLTEEVFKGNTPKFFSIERAHRTPGKPPPARRSEGNPAEPQAQR